jgi:hypothetical protein
MSQASRFACGQVDVMIYVLSCTDDKICAVIYNVRPQPTKPQSLLHNGLHPNAMRL